jgi:hypothetical protein
MTCGFSAIPVERRLGSTISSLGATGRSLGRDNLADHALMPRATELRRALAHGEPHGHHVAVVHRAGADVEAVDREVACS